MNSVRTKLTATFIEWLSLAIVNQFTEVAYKNTCSRSMWTTGLEHAQLYISMIHCKLRADVRASGHLEMLVVTVADRGQC